MRARSVTAAGGEKGWVALLDGTPRPGRHGQRHEWGARKASSPPSPSTRAHGTARRQRRRGIPDGGEGGWRPPRAGTWRRPHARARRDGGGTYRRRRPDERFGGTDRHPIHPLRGGLQASVSGPAWRALGERPSGAQTDGEKKKKNKERQTEALTRLHPSARGETSAATAGANTRTPRGPTHGDTRHGATARRSGPYFWAA